MSIRTLFIGWLLLQAWAPLQAQDVCRQELLRLAKDMQARVNVAGKGHLRAELEIHSQAGGQAPEVVLHTSVSIAPGRSIAENEHFSSYIDPQNRVVVLHTEKQVMIHPQVGTAKAPTDWEQFNEALILTSAVATCRNSGREGGDLVIDLQAQPDKGPIASVRYVVDTRKDLITDMETTYRPGNMLHRYRIRFLSYRPGVVDPRLASPAVDQVLASGRLRPALADHRLRDHRISEKPLAK